MAGDAPAAHFAVAEAVARRLGDGYFVARTLIERARLDVAGGAHDAARERLDQARDLAAQHGFAQIARDADLVD